MNTNQTDKATAAFKFIYDVLSRSQCGDNGVTHQQNALIAKVALEDIQSEYAAMLAAAEDHKTALQVLTDASNDGRGLTFQQVAALVSEFEPALANLAAVRKQ